MKAEGHYRWAGLHPVGAAGFVIAILLVLAVASLASAVTGADKGAPDAEWLEIVLDLEQLPAADRERSQDRLDAIDQAIATQIPLFRSFDPREVLAESLAELASLGVVLDESRGAVLNFDTLGAVVPAETKERVEALPWVQQLRHPVAATPAGVLDSEGLEEIRSDVANAAGTTGAGITVAIIDDSFNHLNAVMTDPGNELANIPTTMQYRVNTGASTITGNQALNGTGSQLLEGEHGTACAEVVYEVAPDVTFILIGFAVQAGGNQYEGGVTAAQIEYAIRRASDLGAKVILVPMYVFHTMSNPTNSFKDDIDYATAAGNTVVVSAGNEELRHVEETFTPCADCTSGNTCATANATDYHAWDPDFEGIPLNDLIPQSEADTAEVFETLTCYSATDAANPSLYEMKLLKFNDDGSCADIPGCPGDCAATMTTVNGTTVNLGQGFTKKNLATLDGDGDENIYYITVRRKVTSTTNLCQSNKCIQNGTTACTTNAQCNAVPWPKIRVACTTGVEELYWATETGKSLSDLAVVSNALTVGGVDAFGELDLFASYGPTGNPGPIKPDLVGPGEVTNFTVQDYGISDAIDFIGSSAAAAHVAGVVALLQSYRLENGLPLLTPAQVKEELQHAAMDLGPPGDDVQYGAGMVQVPPGPQSGVPMVDADPIIDPIVVGSQKVLTGSGFSAGSRILLYVATASGPVSQGPFVPAAWSPTTLTWNVPANIPLGNGFGTTLIVNTDQNFILSNTESQLLYGTAGLNMPTILTVGGVPLSPLDASIPTANVETIISQGSTVTITGTGFNNPLVNLFTAAGNVGPLAPLPGANATQFQITIPAQTVTGPGSFQVVNNPYTGNVLSNAVSVPIGSALDISSITQNGTTVTVNGAGFSVLTVINFFNLVGGNAINFGGLNAQGNAKIPLTFVNENQFTFQAPAGAATGPAYVMALNPPFIPFSSTTGDPQGGFNLTVP